MARRQFQPYEKRRRGLRVPATVFACLVGLTSLPASAATPHRILCSEADQPTLTVAVDEIAATVSHIELIPADYVAPETPDDDAIVLRRAVLEPRAKAAIREAFQEIADVEEAADQELGTDLTDERAEEEPKPRAMNTRLPGVSEERMDRYKRQMYRRDI